MADSYLVIVVSSIALLLSILVFIMALTEFEIHLETDDSNTVPMDADTIYLGGATLIGLATFGSTLGTTIFHGSRDALEKRGAVLMAFGPAGVIGSQGFLMYSTFAFGVHAHFFYPMHVLTLVSAIITILGFNYIVEARFKNRSSKSQGPE